MNKLRIWNIDWEVDTAGPSPNMNNRVELFLKGCNKASNNPCKGCFNDMIWDKSAETLHDPKTVAVQINKCAPNKYISISGGEPLDQIDGLIELCSELKKFDFHILVYTHYELKTLLKNNLDNKVLKLLDNVDILVDGPYVEKLNIYDLSKDDGLHNSVGSSNQIVWDVKYYNDNDNSQLTGIKAEYLNMLSLTIENDLVYGVKNLKIPDETILIERAA